nr:class I SAM-dependent methyltransferase [Acidobacteriota bacterium]
MADRLAYAGRDLESMAFARNYHRWILDLFAPHLGTRLVEVGAGTGSFSELLIERRPASLTLVEPSPDMHRRLVERVGREGAGLRIYNDTFAGVAARVARQ